MGWYGRRDKVSAKTLTKHHGEVSSLCWRERYVHNYLVSVCLSSDQKRSDLVALSEFLWSFYGHLSSAFLVGSSGKSLTRPSRLSRFGSDSMTNDGEYD